MVSWHRFPNVLDGLQGILHRSVEYQDYERGEGFLPGEDDNRSRREFICKLVIALMTYGCSVPRAEFLALRTAERLNIKVSITIFTADILIIFPDAEGNSRDETRLLQFQADLDLGRLQETDELANSVGLDATPLWTANRQLKIIVTTPSPFGIYWDLFGYSVSAATASLLFFSGNLWDAGISLFLGLLVCLLSIHSQRFPLVGSALEFLCAVLVSVAARVLSVHLADLDLCFFAIAVSSLVWLLPGQDLIIGIGEVVQKSIVAGGSRVVSALIVSLQMGFGIALGESIPWWCNDVPIKRTCSTSNISKWWDVLWFIGYAVATNALLKARLWQWPGMMITSGIGMIVDNAISPHTGSEASALIAAFSIGLTGSTLGYFSKDVPLTITFAGIQVLLPDGIGLRGIEEFMHNDVLSGIQFVLSMISICLSITLGLLLSKIVIRDANTGVFNMFPERKRQHVLSFEKTRNDNEQEENEQVAVC